MNQDFICTSSSNNSNGGNDGNGKRCPKCFKKAALNHLIQSSFWYCSSCKIDVDEYEKQNPPNKDGEWVYGFCTDFNGTNGTFQFDWPPHKKNQ